MHCWELSCCCRPHSLPVLCLDVMMREQQICIFEKIFVTESRNVEGSLLRCPTKSGMNRAFRLKRGNLVRGTSRDTVRSSSLTLWRPLGNEDEPKSPSHKWARTRCEWAPTKSVKTEHWRRICDNSKSPILPIYQQRYLAVLGLL